MTTTTVPYALKIGLNHYLNIRCLQGHRKVRHTSDKIVNFEPEFNRQYHLLSSVLSWQIGIQYSFIYLLSKLTVPK
jgi:hypothetical protein